MIRHEENEERRASADELLLRHCRALDDGRPSAPERLEDVLGAPLAHQLVRALARPAGARAGA